MCVCVCVHVQRDPTHRTQDFRENPSGHENYTPQLYDYDRVEPSEIRNLGLTASLPTKIVDFGGFDSNLILI